jgi:flagellar basal-body rod protein FlgG
MPNRALRTAASGMYAQELNVAVISNNIANVNTTSFKKNRAEFEDLMYQSVAANPQNQDLPGIIENPADEIQVGVGVKPSSTQKIFSQGDLKHTGHNLDLAIYGDGFFQLRTPDGKFVYSRDGSFKVSADGSIVSSNGNVLEPGFVIPNDAVDVMISADGVISVRDTSNNTVELGSIELAKFVNPGGLKAMGNNQYMETEASGVPFLGTPNTEEFGQLQQGYLEASNVDIVEEMVNMISAQRAYEINSKAVKTVEDMISITNNLKR